MGRGSSKATKSGGNSNSGGVSMSSLGEPYEGYGRNKELKTEFDVGAHDLLYDLNPFKGQDRFVNRVLGFTDKGKGKTDINVETQRYGLSGDKYRESVEVNTKDLVSAIQSAKKSRKKKYKVRI